MDIFIELAKKMSMTTMLEQLGEGMIKSLSIFGITLVLSLPLGLLVSFGRMSKNPVIRWIAKIYISVMRGTPLMLQLLVVRYGPWFLFGVRLSSDYNFPAVIIAFTINYAAYFAEIYRSGIESMPIGQYEAAKVLGFNRFDTFTRIIFPQVVKRILPSVTNEIITLVKDTSLAYVLSELEMFSLAKQIASSQTSFMPYLFAGLFYYVFNYIIAFVMERVEKSLSYYEIK